ncbi:MAG: hypothetical protein ACON4P_06525, partial [Candidatus Puniceispirillales bacterium]
LLPGGRLSGSILTIELEAPISWADFQAEWLTGDAFDSEMLIFKANADGKAALADLLGLSVEADVSRSVAMGSADADTITIDDDSGDWVIQAGARDDTISLSNGAEEVIYRLAHDGSAFTGNDGRDTITGFDPAADLLHFVDTDASGDALTLTTMVEALDGVSVSFDTANTVIGVDLTVGAETLSITFDTAVALDITPENAHFSDGSAPDGTPGTEELVEAQWGAYLTDIFEDGVAVSETLPVELL